MTETGARAYLVQTAIAAIPAELPSVTSADNGKSIVVENGAWAKGNPTANVIAVMRSDGFLEITNADLIPNAESEVFGS